jgi:glycosyltransferase involved in cell wall biosynthesis
VGTQLIHGLGEAGVEVDCFIAGAEGDVASSLLDAPNVRFFFRPKVWSWGRWYSRHPLLAFLSGHAARARSQLQIVDDIVREHRKRPYDVVYQFSQSEFTPLRPRRRHLPPLVVHPSTHAAGELRWVRRESALALRGESRRRLLAVQAILGARALVQRFELPTADRVLGVSRRFSRHLGDDYRIRPERLSTVINPIDLERFQVGDRSPGSDEMITLLFVSRISVRKGVDLVADLSHRLADLTGQVRIIVIGGPTLWSNYLPILEDLNPEIARFVGQLGARELAQLYAESDALLQPSQYEPFGLTVAEALASGMPTIASDEVGAVDGVDPEVCLTFPAGDAGAFEATVRQLVERLRAGEGAEMRRRARLEAERLFDLRTVTASLVRELEIAARVSS